MRVLIVDDEPGTLNILEAGLVSVGHQVVTASNGRQALQLIKVSGKKEGSVELLVTDLIMPGINGFDLIQSARQLLPGLPAILITAYGVANTRNQTRDLGRCECLEKPFSISELTSAITKLYGAT